MPVSFIHRHFIAGQNTMTPFAAIPNTLIIPTATTGRRSWKKIIRSIFEQLGKQYAHSPYML
jgi:hypothetical protein